MHDSETSQDGLGDMRLEAFRASAKQGRFALLSIVKTPKAIKYVGAGELAARSSSKSNESLRSAGSCLQFGPMEGQSNYWLQSPVHLSGGLRAQPARQNCLTT